MQEEGPEPAGSRSLGSEAASASAECQTTLDKPLNPSGTKFSPLQGEGWPN